MEPGPGTAGGRGLSSRLNMHKQHYSKTNTVCFFWFSAPKKIHPAPKVFYIQLLKKGRAPEDAVQRDAKLVDGKATFAYAGVLCLEGLLFF